MSSNIERVNLTEVFKNVKYRVPMYQRNYEWGADDVENLINDINGNDTDYYYIGTLVVDADDHKKNVYEVIDGQQRLTTLYLLQTYLSSYKQKDNRFDFGYIKGTLLYEARKTYSVALNDPEGGKVSVSEIKDRYKTIKNCFEAEKSSINVEAFYEKLQKSFLIRVQVPPKTDLNQYFEIMNTRGEQLRPHQIIKARILSKLKAEDRKAAAVIWDCCSNMDRYVQMNFNKTARSRIFGEEDWTSEVFKKGWRDIRNILDASYREEKVEDFDETANKQLINLLEKAKENPLGYYKKEDEDALDKGGAKKSDYESIISFPNFLLQVNAMDTAGEGESESDRDDDPSLDDSNFIKILEKGLWEGIAETLDKDVECRKRAENFLLKLLGCRVLFDMYVLKRNTKEDNWSLKKLKKRVETVVKKKADGKQVKEQEESADEVLTYGDDDTVRLRRLQSLLRITYTSPKTMRWITKVLKLVWGNATSGKGNDNPKEIINLLEDYCREKIIKSDYENKRGFAIKRIVFSYLDYLLLYSAKEELKSKYEMKDLENWGFFFSSKSVEHFFPQHPDRNPWGDVKEVANYLENWPAAVNNWQHDLNRWEVKDEGEVPVDIFGNLALVDVSGNSSLSNRPPIVKAIKAENVIVQSIKLRIMAWLTKKNDGRWTKDLAENHGKEMLEILQEDIKKLPRENSLQVAQDEQKPTRLDETSTTTSSATNGANPT